MTVEQHALDPDTVRRNLDAARRRRDELWAQYEEAIKAVEWWEQGAKLFGVVTEPELSAQARLIELLPDQPDGTRLQPTLKQAMLLIMRSNPFETWTVEQISLMLGLNNWLPKSEPNKRISDMAGVMVNEALLERIDRGTYRLVPEIAQALANRFPPVTDYSRVPDDFPVPDHPAANDGLAEDS